MKTGWKNHKNNNFNPIINWE